MQRGKSRQSALGRLCCNRLKGMPSLALVENLRISRSVLASYFVLLCRSLELNFLLRKVFQQS